jgi:hypothetical protein
MKKNHHVDGYNVYYRSPKTRNEKRANQDDEFVRAKRKPKNLTDFWDDKPISEAGSKTWKRKRKTQHNEEERGTKHVIEGTSMFPSWELSMYFTKHDIPHDISNRSGNKKFPVKVVYWTDKNIDIEKVLNETNAHYGNRYIDRGFEYKVTV